MEALGREALSVETDVTKSDQVNEMVKKSLERFGKIDILVNNAGIGGRIVSIVKMRAQDWDAVLDVNLKGVFLCSKAVVPHMIRQGSGKIINIASRLGKTGSARMRAYSSSKHAVIGFTRSLALELAIHKINVNAVCPGSVPGTHFSSQKTRRRLAEEREEIGLRSYGTPPLGRNATPEDVAKIVAFLASQESDFMTGQAINITGGREVHCLLKSELQGQDGQHRGGGVSGLTGHGGGLGHRGKNCGF